jgi:phosphatidate phosphatase APP1
MFRMLTIVLLLNCAVARSGQKSNLKPDQQLLFYPSICHCVDGKSWQLEVHGCVYEPDKRTAGLALLREFLALNHVHLNDIENTLFTERARLFMVDHKGGKRIVVRIGGRDFDLGKSSADGNFSGVVRLSDDEAKGLANGAAAIQAVLRPKDARVFSGDVNLFGQTGVMVISDIDDTIKLTQVRDRRATLRHTFLEPFEPVPGMAELYRTWAGSSGAQFCYVSASPWALFAPLADFARSNGFPAGVFYLKKFHWKDESILSMFENPEKYKPGVIEPLLKMFPQRTFVLVGDSGERDPEIYAALAREHPQQISHIFIRNVTGETADAERYKTAFHDLKPELWKIFQEPAEIKNAVKLEDGKTER